MRKHIFLSFLTLSTPSFAATKYYISIHGGALAGIIPTLLLEEIEKQTEKPIVDQVDGFIGSSMGAVISACATTPSVSNTMADVRDHLLRIAPNLPSFLLTMAQTLMFGSNVFADYVGSAYLSQVKTRLIVSSYTYDCASQFRFDSELAKKSAMDDAPIWQVLRASTSIWFQQNVDFNTTSSSSYTDAGVFGYNDPTDFIAGELFEEIKETDDDIVIYSLGTGFSNAAGWKSHIDHPYQRIKVVYIEPDFSEVFTNYAVLFLKKFMSRGMAQNTFINVAALHPYFFDTFTVEAKRIIAKDPFFKMMLEDFKK